MDEHTKHVLDLQNSEHLTTHCLTLQLRHHDYMSFVFGQNAHEEDVSEDSFNKAENIKNFVRCAQGFYRQYGNADRLNVDDSHGLNLLSLDREETKNSPVVGMTKPSADDRRVFITRSWPK